MHPSPNRPVHGHIRERTRQFIGAWISALFVNPFGFIAAVIGVWMTIMAVGPAVRLMAEGTVWTVLGYGIGLLALALITVLATAHLLLTAIAGWNGFRHC
ncbi:MAG: hypothetical protein WBL15_21290 [Phycisphaerae bacterium]|nr:hypothetical protein [Phycisphaerae bacterium]HQE42602.1 hypothetical protein [Phycisphaerae bacterium]